MHFLADYGLFLAKTLTFILGLLITFSALIGIALKNKKEEGQILISSVNERLDDIRESLQSEALPKHKLKKWLKSLKKEEKEKKKQEKEQETQSPRLFIVRFDGDVRASQVTSLRETISAIIQIAQPIDEVLVILESAGGFVHSYGLAASQLQRLRQRNLYLTVAIDKLAASGGYLMACVANKIIAAPFAIVGSIGVVAQLPNFHRLLNKHNIDVELHTAGQYKRTLTLFGKNTDKARKKFQEELEDTHALFKEYISLHRPQVNIDEVSTGEHWHALKALQLNLLDEIQTSDDFILEQAKAVSAFEVSYEKKQNFSEKLTSGLFQATEKLFLKWFQSASYLR